MGLREEKKAELRRQIRNTALRLFEEHGMSATRVADIAALLRISEATFFNYFPSKQAICEEAVADLITHSIDTALEDSDRAVAAQLGALAAELISQLTADRPLITLVRRQPELITTGYFRMHHPVLALTRTIGRAQTRGELRDDVPTAVISEACLGAILIMVGRTLQSDAPPSELNTALAQILDLWTEGCAPRSGSRARTGRRAPMWMAQEPPDIDHDPSRGHKLGRRSR